MQNFFAGVIATALLATVQQASATCYSVYRNQALILQTATAPVDMSLPMSQTVPAKFGVGATMVFNNDACTEVVSSTSGSAMLGGANASRGQDRAGAPYREQAATMVSGELPRESGARNVDLLNNLTAKSGGGSAEGSQGSYSSDVMTGPRGGQYRINSNGNKTYLSSGGGRSGRR